MRASESSGNLTSTVSALLATALPLLLLACHESKEQQAANAAPEVTVMTLAAQDTPVSYEFVGQTTSSRQVDILARVNGFLEKRTYEEGSMVKAGQTLFIQDQKPFKAQLSAARAALSSQEARLVVAQQNLGRVRPLAARNALSQRELDDAIGQEKSASAAVDEAKANLEQAQLNLSYTVITTPVSGASSFARVHDGQYVDASSGQLTYVAQLDPIWVDFSISENDMLKIRTDAQQGRLRLPARDEYEVHVILADGTEFPTVGRITFANADYSQKTGTYALRATLPNADGVLRPGQFVRVKVTGAVRPKALLVPQQAVLQGASGHFVVVVDKDNKAQVRPVEVGPWQGKDWFITNGLAPGDNVVVDGMVKLAPGSPVKVATAPEKPPPLAQSPGGSTER
jgi:membrane fusion protein (multidrug efflux system)